MTQRGTDDLKEIDRFLRLLALAGVVGAPLAVLAILGVALLGSSLAPARPDPISPETCLGAGGRLHTNSGKYNSVDCLRADGTSVKVFIEGGRRP